MQLLWKALNEKWIKNGKKKRDIFSQKNGGAS